MSIRIKTVGATDLRPASNITKRNFTTAITVGSTSGKVVGFAQLAFVRIPGSGFTSNTIYPFWGSDSGGTGSFANGSDDALLIGGDNVGQSTLRLKPRVGARSAGVNAYAAASQNFVNVGALTANGSDVYLVAKGVQNTGTDASPVWKGWAAVVKVGGAASSEVIATALAASYITSTSGILLAQIFNSRSSTTVWRSPVGLTFENWAHIKGDFPWDTVNDRPHHDALLALANGTGAPSTLHSYASLIAAQNAGTLGSGGGYANLRANAKADVAFHWTLTNLSTGLTNNGTDGTNALARSDWNSLTDGLEDGPVITPAHWTVNPTITEPALKFLGGRGTLPLTIAGTYQAGTKALQRRWVLAGTSTVVSGFDWASVTVFGGAGTWSTTDTLPVGRFDLQIRDTNDTTRTATMTNYKVGARVLVHGQSSADQLTFGEGDTASPLGLNRLSLAVDAGASGMLLRYANQVSAATWVGNIPTIVAGDMLGGTTPAVAHGAVAILNQWNVHNPGEPLLIVSVAVGGTSMADWAENIQAAANGNPGNASWRFMGTVGATPDGTSGNNSGIIEYMAQYLGRQIDLHMTMWTPGLSATAGVAGSPDTYANATAGSRLKYRMGVDERFSNSASAPWLIFPVWRIARANTEASGTQSKRQEHLSFVTELGARGIQGPCWLDPVMVKDVGHAVYTLAYNEVANMPGDGNQVGQAKLGHGVGRSIAWAFNRTIKAHGPRLVAAWSDNSRATVNIECGRVLRTLGGAALDQNQFWVSLNNGSTFLNASTASPTFTAALDATGTRVVLTPADGGTAWAAGSNLRVEYGWNFPFSPGDGTISGYPGGGTELTAETNLRGLLYDDQTYRGNTDLTPRAGNPLQGTSRFGVGLAGLPVAVRGNAKLYATERWTGTRTITVQMIAADGMTVLREKTLAITAS